MDSTGTAAAATSVAIAASVSGCGQMSIGTTTAAGRPSTLWQPASTELRLSSSPSRKPARTVTPGQDWLATSMMPAATSIAASVGLTGNGQDQRGRVGWHGQLMRTVSVSRPARRNRGRPRGQPPEPRAGRQPRIAGRAGSPGRGPAARVASQGSSDSRAGSPGSRVGSPGSRVGSPGFRVGSSEPWPGRPGSRTGSPESGAAGPGLRAGSSESRTGSPESRVGSSESRAGRLGLRTGRSGAGPWSVPITGP